MEPFVFHGMDTVFKTFDWSIDNNEHFSIKFQV